MYRQQSRPVSRFDTSGGIDLRTLGPRRVTQLTFHESHGIAPWDERPEERRGGLGRNGLWERADGDDLLKGGLGRDYLTGYAGTDVMFGGGGQDTFSFNQASDSSPTASRTSRTPRCDG